MAFSNFTVNVVSFNEAVGEDWTQAHPSVTLIITPNAGYEINATNFSPKNPLPPFVQSVTFTQSGFNIECVILYIEPSEMPDNDVLIALCITGYASLIGVSVAGIVTYNTTFTSPPTPPTSTAPYSGTGLIFSTSEIANLVVKADNGYYFPVLPTASLAMGTLADYSIVPTLTNDSAGNLIQVNFAVNYTFPNYSVTGDSIIVEANASEIYNPTVGISAYSINTSLIGVGGETRTMTVFGSSGSVFTIAMDGVDLVTNITMEANGSYSFPIVFPAVTTNTTYSILLSGDLVNPFTQPNPFTIQQRVNTEVTFSVSFPDGIATQSSVVKSYLPFQSPPVGDAAEVINFGWSITPMVSSNLILIRQPTIDDWSNLNPVLNGGTAAYPIAAISLQDPATGGTIAVGGNMDAYGGIDMETVLDLTNIIQVQSYTELTLCYAGTEADLCCGTSESRTVFVAGNVANLASVTGLLYTTSDLDVEAQDGFYSDDVSITCTIPVPTYYYYLLRSCYGNGSDTRVARTDTPLPVPPDVPVVSLYTDASPAVALGCFALYGYETQTEEQWTNNEGTLDSVDIAGLTILNTCSECNQ